MLLQRRESNNLTSLRILFPDVSDDQLAKIEEALCAYLDALWRIYERLQREHAEVFDTDAGAPYYKTKVDSH